MASLATPCTFSRLRSTTCCFRFKTILRNVATEGLSDKLRGAHGPDWLDNVTIFIHRRLQRPGNLVDVGHVHLGFQADHRKPRERLLQQRELAAACRAAEHDETLVIQGPHKRAHLLHWKLDDCHWQ